MLVGILLGYYSHIARHITDKSFPCLNPTTISLQLMDIDKAGTLVVNYSERLVRLLREVRQLSELGFSIPSKISKVRASRRTTGSGLYHSICTGCDSSSAKPRNPKKYQRMGNRSAMADGRRIALAKLGNTFLLRSHAPRVT